VGYVPEYIANISLSGKNLTSTNALAYFTAASVTHKNVEKHVPEDAIEMMNNVCMQVKKLYKIFSVTVDEAIVLHSRSLQFSLIYEMK
jgi:hypothetical protein